jgi:uncharacterized membrane protein YkgB
MKKSIERIDEKIINFCKRVSIPTARFAIVVIFVWFGALKVLGTSAANPLVITLFNETFLSGMDALTFTKIFGVFEMLLGILFLFPRLERIIFLFLFFHLVTTILPLFILPDLTWAGTLTPTLTGQYIIKNLLLLSLEVIVIAHLRPMTKSHKFC